MNTSRKCSATFVRPGWNTAFWSTSEPRNSKSANSQCPRSGTSLRRNSRKRQGQPQEANDDERGQPARALISFGLERGVWLNPIGLAAKNEKRRKEGLTCGGTAERTTTARSNG